MEIVKKVQIETNVNENSEFTEEIRARIGQSDMYLIKWEKCFVV